MHHRDDSFLSAQMTFLAGVGAGLVLHMLLPEDTRRRVDNSVKELANRAKDSLPATGLLPQANRAVADIFDTYSEVKDATLENLRTNYKRWQDIDGDKYQESLDEVLQSFVDDGRIDGDEIERLRDYMVRDFETFRAKTFQK